MGETTAVINEILYRYVKMSSEETIWVSKILGSMKEKEAMILSEIQTGYKAEKHVESFYALSSIVVLKRGNGIKVHQYAMPYLISGLADFIRYFASKDKENTYKYLEILRIIIDFLQRNIETSPKLSIFFKFDEEEKIKILQELANVQQPKLSISKRSSAVKGKGYRTLELEYSEIKFLIQLIEEKREWATARGLYSLALEHVCKNLRRKMKSYKSHWVRTYSFHVYLATVLLSFLEWYGKALNDVKHSMFRNNNSDSEAYIQLVIQDDLISRLIENIKKTYEPDTEDMRRFYHSSLKEQEEALEKIL